MNMPLSLVIEGLVAALLVITIGYCVLLNKRLKRLRADEESLRATIAELLTATEIAERAIHGLRAASAECDANLGGRITQATALSDELSSKLTAADAVVQRIGKLAAASRSPAPAMASGATAPASGRPVASATKASQRLDSAARTLQERLQRAV
ncbi:MAG: DUF6468 domain-containing protein [Pseudomonadota bacterium]